MKLRNVPLRIKGSTGTAFFSQRVEIKSATGTCCPLKIAADNVRPVSALDAIGSEGRVAGLRPRHAAELVSF